MNPISISIKYGKDSTTLVECDKCTAYIDASFRKELIFPSFDSNIKKHRIVTLCPDCLLRVWKYSLVK